MRKLEDESVCLVNVSEGGKVIERKRKKSERRRRENKKEREKERRRGDGVGVHPAAATINIDHHRHRHHHRHHHHQQLSHLGEGYIHQHLQQNQLLSNPSSSLVFNLCTKTIDWCL